MFSSTSVNHAVVQTYLDANPTLVQAQHNRALLGPITDFVGNITGGIIKPSIAFQNGSVQTGVEYTGPLGLLNGISKTTVGITYAHDSSEEACICL
jgi:hypothetical protein